MTASCTIPHGSLKLRTHPTRNVVIVTIREKGRRIYVDDEAHALELYHRLARRARRRG